MINSEKNNFINHLSDSTSSVTTDRLNLSKIPESEFSNSEQVSNEISESDNRMWNGDYFHEQLSRLRRKDFSKERCNHIIEVKDNLQKRNIKGFSTEEKSHSESKNNVSEHNKDNGLNLDSNNIDSEHIEKILADYKPKDRLLNDILKDNIQGIKRNVEFDLNNNRLTIEDIIKTIFYVYKNYSKAFVPYEEDKFCLAIDENSEHWDKDYFTIQQSYLNHNFSLERLLHLVNVKQHLVDNKVEGFEFIKVQPKKNVEQNGQQNKNSERKSNVRQDIHKAQDKGILKTAVMIGGAVLAGILALIALTR